jgi:hypothetical protein
VDRIIGKALSPRCLVVSPIIPARGGTMDFRKLAIFILVLGALVFGYGGIKYLSNQPQQLKSPNPLEALKTVTNNLMSADARETGKKIMIGGAVLFIIGLGVLVSAKGKQSTK